ncbi:MAG: DUF481 domain-containing protein [Saprospirales bacterium]|nr:MAG: DUF481 domain-containing protein [Saprospirales bacterium]
MIPYFKWLSLILLTGFTIGQQEVQGQILNIERHRLQVDTAKSWMINGTIGLRIYNRSAAADSPVDMFGYNANINTVYFAERHSYALIGQLDYLKINDADFLNFGFLHLRTNLFHRNPSSIEIFGQLSYDNFRGLDPRVLFGAGLRKRLVYSENSTLHLGVGALFESEWWNHPSLEKTVDVQYLKSTNYLSFRHTFNEYVDFNAIIYYQLGYDRDLSLARHRTSGVVNLNARLSRIFSLTNSFEFNYENKPIVPITRFIFHFKTGFTMGF